MVVVGVIGETAAGENRVALTPAVVPGLADNGMQVVVAAGAGQAAGYPDDAYRDKGAQVVEGRDQVLASQVIARVQAVDAVSQNGEPNQDLAPADSVLIGLCTPLAAPGHLLTLAERG